MTQSKEEQGLIWDYYKPRQVHAWNMLCLAWKKLERADPEECLGFEIECYWENFILRLWLYRTAIRALTKIETIATGASDAVKRFDAQFDMNGRNGLKALRDMIEHFADYAAGKGRGPAQRETDLDPWRCVAIAHGVGRKGLRGGRVDDSCVDDPRWARVIFNG